MRITIFLAISFILASISAFTPKQIIKTKLVLFVRNELGNLEEGAKVRLFKTKEDYDSLKNPATETLLTNDKGKVSFVDLEALPYYIHAEKGARNNYGGGEKTEQLEPNRINKVTIVISE